MGCIPQQGSAVPGMSDAARRILPLVRGSRPAGLGFTGYIRRCAADSPFRAGKPPRRDRLYRVRVHPTLRGGVFLSCGKAAPQGSALLGTSDAARRSFPFVRGSRPAGIGFTGSGYIRRCAADSSLSCVEAAPQGSALPGISDAARRIFPFVRESRPLSGFYCAKKGCLCIKKL